MRRLWRPALIALTLAACSGSSQTAAACSGLPTAKTGHALPHEITATTAHALRHDIDKLFRSASSPPDWLTRRFLCAHFGRPSDIGALADGRQNWVYGIYLFTIRRGRVIHLASFN